jgi:hypothetical protein
VSLWDSPLQIITTIITALAFLATILIYYKSRKIKKLSYKILTDIAITPHNGELSGRIKLCYEENPDKLITISDGRLFIIKILNDGKEPIKLADFVEPISISLAPQVSILDKDIIESPDALEKPRLDVSKNIAILKPLLLNEKEFVIIKLILTGSKAKTDFKIRARIVGITDIKCVKNDIIMSIIGPLFLLVGSLIMTISVTGNHVIFIIGLSLWLIGFFISEIQKKRL